MKGLHCGDWLNERGNSFINKLNKSGLKMQPCLTPRWYWNASVLDLLILIEHVVFGYKDLINE